jgi:GntR family transcriptional regulator
MAMQPTTLAQSTGRLGYSPLYLQVKQQLIEKMISGEWPPGSLLPSEQQLGAQMGVSQGTVRKALDGLAAENVVVRHQGRGTFVSEHDQKRTLFQFFKIVDESGERRFPETVMSRLTARSATAKEREGLALPAGAKVWHIHRFRALNENVALIERITLSARKFAKLDTHAPLPNNIYQLYERQYGVTVARAVERLRAVKASAEDASALGCAAADPVLQIDRIAYGLDGQAAELRRTICLTEHLHYLSDLH